MIEFQTKNLTLLNYSMYKEFIGLFNEWIHINEFLH